MLSPSLALTRILSAAPPRLRVVGPDEGADDRQSGSRAGSGGRPPTGFRRGVAALHHRNYRYYWFGQIVSLIGTWMQSVSQPWLVLLLGGSPLQLGIVLALEFTPPMFLAPLGGVLADRVDKRKALVVTSVMKAVQAVILFALTITGVV
ncbi:MAG TPA: MFS transporter, partial [Candidatus Limnocylindria bacterium]